MPSACHAGASPGWADRPSAVAARWGSAVVWVGAARLPPEGQGGDAEDEAVALEHDVALRTGEAQCGNPAQDRLEDDLELRPREILPQARVDAPAEREVLAVVPVDVEHVRV